MENGKTAIDIVYLISITSDLIIKIFKMSVILHTYRLQTIKSGRDMISRYMHI